MNFEGKHPFFRSLVAALCTIVITPGDTLAYSPQSSTPAQTPSSQTAKISPEQLDSLVAPIALYPDPLLAQVLAASTYPIEIVELQQRLSKNSGLKDKALTDARSEE